MTILTSHIKNIEENLKIITSEYYFQITNQPLNFKKDLSHLISFINTNKKEIKIGEKIVELLQNLGNLNDIYIYIDILQFLHTFSYSLNNNITHKQEFNFNFFENSLQELKILTKYILNTNESLIEDEIIQRFFETSHFIFKYLKFPKMQKDVFSDFVKKDLTLAVKCSMQINLQREDSFTIDCDNKMLKNEDEIYKKREIREKLIKNNINNGNTNFTTNEFEYAFTNLNKKEHLFEFKLDIIKSEIAINEKRELKNLSIKSEIFNPPKKIVGIVGGGKEINYAAIIDKEEENRRARIFNQDSVLESNDNVNGNILDSLLKEDNKNVKFENTNLEDNLSSYFN